MYLFYKILRQYDDDDRDFTQYDEESDIFRYT